VKKQKYPVANPHVNQPKAFIILIFIALLFIAGGIVFAIFASKGVQGYVKTQATIVDIDYPLFYNDSTTAYVDYTFNGITYSHQMLDSYTSGWGIGTVVDIYVDPQNPSSFHSTLTSSVAPYLIIGAGGFLLLIVFLGGVSDLINCRVFAPKKTGENKIEVRIARVTYAKNIAQTIYRIQFAKDGSTYQSGRLGAMAT
jgi:hypothetical protein